MDSLDTGFSRRQPRTERRGWWAGPPERQRARGTYGEGPPVSITEREGVAPLAGSPRRPSGPARRSRASRFPGPVRFALSGVRVAAGEAVSFPGGTRLGVDQAGHQLGALDQAG